MTRCILSSQAYADPIAHREGIAISDATITPGSLRNQNESIATNLTPLFPKTPKGPAPNSAKKRKRMPHLSRPFATPGHGAKMSMIFSNAATSLQESRSPTHQPSPNIKKSRLPFSQRRSTNFSSTCQHDTIVSRVQGDPPKMNSHLGDSCGYQASGASPYCPTPTASTRASHATIGNLTNRCLESAKSISGICLDGPLGLSGTSSPLRIEEESREPISSGFSTPVPRTFVENPEEVKYPILEDWRSPRSSSNAYSHGSDSNDLHSTHGVPSSSQFLGSYEEEVPRPNIDTWLNGILEVPTSELPSSPEHTHGRDGVLIDDAPFPQSITSNISSSTRIQVSPSKFKQAWRTPSRASSNKENHSPSKYSSSPICPPVQPFRTKRKRLRADEIAANRAEVEMSTAHRDFTIHEDHINEALAQLSPDVERHRKGRGPKKERCMSYWDEDILQPSFIDVNGHGESMGKAKVLRESQQAVGSTTEQHGT